MFRHELAVDGLCRTWLRETRRVDTPLAIVGAVLLARRLLAETGASTITSTAVYDDLRALVDMLGAQAFFHGDRPGKVRD